MPAAVGESEEAVRALFKRARRVAPSIVFFDEIDAFPPLKDFSFIFFLILNFLLTMSAQAIA